MLGGGLRLAEASALNVEDITKRPGGILRLSVRGKGRKLRVVPIASGASSEILSYLKATKRTLSSTGPLFLARAKQRTARLASRTISGLVAEMAQDAGIVGERITPHSLRHTYAVHALKNGVELHELSRLLGHASITTTMIYIDHINGEELESKIPQMIGAD